MHPEEIKAALRINGKTLTTIAEATGVSRSMVTHVIHGYAKSAKVMDLISKTIGKPVAAIWADKPVLRRTKQPAARAAA